jgi:glycosyltransferase involved in cell wall biosynthesis
MAQQRFDIVLVESEPWAWIRWQSWLWTKIHQPRAIFGEFSWENMARPGWKGRIINRFYRLAAATSQFAIAGNCEAAMLFEEAGMARRRILVAPQLGVDEALFHPVAASDQATLRTSLAIPQDAFVVGFCGRLEAFKGVLDLVDAVETLRTRLSSPQVVLALLGTGPLKSQIDAHSCQRPWLRLLAPLPHHRVCEFMQAIDVLVLPSKAITSSRKTWTEQFGHVLIEAMACGTPVLGSRTGAIPEVLNLLEATFEAGDVAALSNLLVRLIENPDWRKSITQRQLERVSTFYTNERLALQWSQFLQNIALTKPVKVVLLSDTRLLPRGHRDRPRRFLDPSTCPPDWDLYPRALIWRDSDEAVEATIQNIPGRQWGIWYLLSVINLLRTLPELASADLILCGNTHYFWWLRILANPFPFLRRHITSCFFFRGRSLQAKLPWLNTAPPNFHPYVISSEQKAELQRQHCGAGRLKVLRWPIDTDWFSPHAGSPTSRRYIFCPGTVHRDESLVASLIPLSPLPIIRAGRNFQLATYYAKWNQGNEKFELQMNLDHGSYLSLMQNATAVILPIEDCDEPAGFTAALEALAVGVPLIANASLGIDELFRAAYGRPPLLDLDPQSWLDAIQQTQVGAWVSPPQVLAARNYVARHHSLNFPTEAWIPCHQHFDEAPSLS